MTKFNQIYIDIIIDKEKGYIFKSHAKSTHVVYEEILNPYKTADIFQAFTNAYNWFVKNKIKPEIIITDASEIFTSFVFKKILRQYHLKHTILNNSMVRTINV